MVRNWTQPCIVIDVDQTLCPLKLGHQEYADLEPIPAMVERLRKYREKGWYIIIHTARQMRTHSCNIGRINAVTVPVLIGWLTKHGVPFDEIWPDKPWCGFSGIYVDDHTVPPKDFLSMSWDCLKAKVDSQVMT